jgi:hypothetical protein
MFMTLTGAPRPWDEILPMAFFAARDELYQWYKNTTDLSDAEIYLIIFGVCSPSFYPPHEKKS